MKRLKVIIFIFLLMLLTLGEAFANAAEPPSVIVISRDVPENARVYFLINHEYIRGEVRHKFGETYYACYVGRLKETDSIYLEVISHGGLVLMKFELNLKEYTNIYTLDYSHGSLKEGKGLLRTALLVFSRLSMTLILEGLVFYSLGYRSKETWKVFLIVNLITQGFLNIWLSLSMHPLESYLLLILIFGEFFVFLVEFVTITPLVHEHSYKRNLITVFLANSVSLYVGGIMIQHLPI
ncbi:MAG: hypothetical protein JXR88_04575 [Clostridia bacterium]|nr:hypothetical protein [Clostridia bacterium]